MVSTQMWFGTRDYMQWIKPPQVGMGSPKVGWSTQQQFLNGGAYARRSVAAHKEYQMTWNMVSPDVAQVVTDYADRVYGTGAIYWVDPFNMERNMLPQWFAVPSQGLDDGLPLNGGARPVSSATPANLLGYPTTSALYTNTTGVTGPQIWVPVPPGYTLWFGAHGTAGTGGNVTVTPTTGPTTLGTPTALSLMAVTSSTRVNYSLDSNAGANTGAFINLAGNGTVTLSGIMAQCWPTGTTPPTGNFISGSGHSGCQFKDQPQVTPYSAVLNGGRWGVTADFIETQGWV
jgi:hypothetical protein